MSVQPNLFANVFWTTLARHSETICWYANDGKHSDQNAESHLICQPTVKNPEKSPTPTFGEMFLRFQIHQHCFTFTMQVMEILSRQDIGPMDATRYSKCKSKATMPLATDVSETFNVSS